MEESNIEKMISLEKLYFNGFIAKIQRVSLRVNGKEIMLSS